MAGLSALPYKTIVQNSLASKDVVFLINGQMFSCKGSLEHVVQVRKDGQGGLREECAGSGCSVQALLCDAAGVDEAEVRSIVISARR